MAVSALSVVLLPLLFMGVLLVRAGKKGRWVAGLGVLPVLGFLFVARVSSDVAVRRNTVLQQQVTLAREVAVNTQESLDQVESPKAQVLEPGGDQPEPWRSASDLGLDADVYPSQREAAHVLLGKVFETQAAHPPAPFRIVGVRVDERVAESLGPCIIERVTRPDTHGAQQVNPQVTVYTHEPQNLELDNSFAGTVLRLEATGKQAGKRIVSGTLRLSMKYSGWQTERTARFADEPWVENPSAFISATPGHWIVAFSSSQATSTVEARQQALANAAAQLIGEVRAELQKTPGTSVDDRWLASQIERVLTGGTGIMNRFVQTFVRPYGGQVCREALLINVDPVRDAALAQGSRSLALSHNSWLVALTSALGLLLFVCVVGVVLNIITKGYYRGHVVVAGTFFLVVGMLVMLKVLAAVRAQQDRPVAYQDRPVAYPTMVAPVVCPDPAEPQPGVTVIRQELGPDGYQEVRYTTP